MTQLPGVLAEIASVAGEDAALAIARARGGTQIYIPPEPAADHWLSRLVGHDRALKIGDELTAGALGRRVDLPVGPNGRKARETALVDALIEEGLSEREIVLKTGYTGRAIRMRKARLKDRRQLDLL